MLLAVGMLGGSASLAAGEPAPISRVLEAIPDAAYTRDVILIGEAHGRSLSYRFVTAVIDRSLSHGQCPTLALEVRHDQAAAWRNGEPLILSSVHDSSAYRRAIARWAERYRSTCVRLAMVDATPDERRSPDFAGRDRAMADRIVRLAKVHGPVIALLGNNHDPRRVDWVNELLPQSFGHELETTGVELTTIAQAFKPIGDQRLIIADDRPASVAAFNRFQWHRNVRRARDLTGYVDLLINWPAVSPVE